MSAHDEMIRRGFSESYATGYDDGTNSGSLAGGNPYAVFKKDPNRYDSDSQYRQGWNDGFQVAKGRYESLGR